MGERQIPLPAGKWELVLAETDRRGSVKAGTAFLVQKVDGKFAGYVFVMNEPAPMPPMSPSS